MTDQPKRKRGRPPGSTKPKERRKDDSIHIRLTEAEHELYKYVGPERVREFIRKEGRRQPPTAF